MFCSHFSDQSGRRAKDHWQKRVHSRLCSGHDEGEVAHGRCGTKEPWPRFSRRPRCIEVFRNRRMDFGRSGEIILCLCFISTTCLFRQYARRTRIRGLPLYWVLDDQVKIL
jgi:hypothetical protein